ncbi:MAG: amino acid ABC transporter substrate-binding protein, partial [Anaerolineae bacterium]
MKRKLFVLLTVLAIVSIALAACGSAATPQTAPTAAPQATEAPPKPAAAEKTVTIGFTSSLTGSQEVSSKRQVAGFNLWMKQVNDAGGLKL